MKKSVIIFFLILVIAFFFTNYIEDYKVMRVSDVIDGDTIRIGDNKIVRLIGINAPEIDEPCYSESKKELEKLIEHKKIKLERDVKGKDEYGRLLRYIFVNDLFVNSEMIRLGLAKFEEIKPNRKYSSLFLEMENKARKARRCIWK